MQGFQLFEHAATVPTRSYNTEEWQRGYRSLKEEHSYWIEEIEGEIPTELNGTLFRNGPGLLDINGERIQHPFDGDGMISAIAFHNGRAHYRNRFVKTEGYLAEQKTGKILYRGVFGTQKAGGWLANAFDTRIKNIANTQVLYWGGKLLALWEAAEPHRLDPKTLETIGLEYFDGELSKGAPFAAHPWIDPSSQFDQGNPCLVNFSIKAGLSFTISIYELDLDGKIVRHHEHPVPGFAFIHDFAITPNYCIFFQNPVAFNPLPFLAGLRSAGECIKFRPDQPTKVLIIPRDPALKAKPKILETPSGFVFHHANAFEQDGEIVLDSICYESLPSVEPGSDYRETDFDALAPGQLWRFRMNLESGTVDRQLLEPRCCEFPFIHPALAGRQHRYVYLAAAHAESGNAPHQAILKVDVETGERQTCSFAPDGYVSEPVFVPRGKASESGLYTEVQGAEDDGWLIAVVFDVKRDRSDVVIVDAKDLSVVAKLHLKHHIPYGLHGSFTPHYFE
ncbi:9-cis-epoxycarotenoid dioxygenase [Leptolyngbya boryana NIES-2135]|jgi:all-trans-8'-apo-beta-carotenal 15,15'-oxygenase|uniref:9-cis-epoxycarotenoid dioxygenase n=1 Tax=Leptolyngbya boryana NIES-2135 TaxID=1973484 RepID=A0A1Z4JIC0_LEPBY|nr:MULTISPECIES: carotenoid oxygenase family protein [Leptolyngbya]BAY56525.1 9-cis-epoxycarotenoid dioxygenase [Leptolyngbya boryana NIES-2135]MBD2369830.1 carotenoid oxygenase family protein [Leptolyngbya sp. FACHB-161]MBD2376225.1 carotenoid oxygenase family protein [Leptolyngbya sp. FACHB-238]MBD2400500.1 carotenoid oxygenase family protein [Leptolyngbya sp. FACHB-239]MBD2407042.1 carotenoid oxygenase family protein [Leptolyngbya sp. FACHB-402]